MNENRYALAALDMDGTLLNTDHETTAFTRDALRRVAQAGGVLALCTGRCLSELTEHLATLPGIAYAICENGGSLYDVAADRVLFQATIPDSDAGRILALTEGYDVVVQCFYGERSHLKTMAPEDLAPVLFENGHEGHSDNYCLVRTEEEHRRGTVHNIQILAAGDGRLLGK